MSEIYISLRDMVCGRRRRLRYWAVAVSAIVVLLSLQSLWPEWCLLPTLSETLAPATLLAVFLAALLCEFIDSSLGMGYGTTLTPLLLIAGFGPLEIVPCVLLSEFVTGLAAGLMHHKDGNIDFLRDGHARSAAYALTLLSAVGAVAAALFAVSVPKLWLTAIISVIILSVGVVTLATSGRRLRYRRGHLILVGLFAAFNKGLSGGGYGPMVTAGQVVSGMSPKHAVAITSLAESFTCLVGLIAYLVVHASAIDWTLAPPLSVGALLSVPIATLTVKGLPEPVLRGSVGVITVLLGILTAVKLFT